MESPTGDAVPAMVHHHLTTTGPGRPRLKRYLPHVAAATFSVVVLPTLLVWGLEATGRLDSPPLAAGMAIVLSFAFAAAGTAWWARQRGSRDIVFGDLLIWGWVVRVRNERRIRKARELLGLDRRISLRRAPLSSSGQAEALEKLAFALESRDRYTHGHSRRVTRHAYMIARKMGLPRETVAKVRAAAAMHDVGKINLPRDIINKAGRLTDEEFEVIQRHPVEGAEMVAGVRDPEMAAMVRHHHERLDGSGYPDRLAGADIPLGARIIAVADTFDAVTSTRSYRPARPHSEAIEILNDEAGKQLDPDVVAAFLSYYRGKRGIAWSAFVTTAIPAVSRIHRRRGRGSERQPDRSGDCDGGSDGGHCRISGQSSEFAGASPPLECRPDI